MTSDPSKRARLLALAPLVLGLGCTGEPAPVVEETGGQLGNGVFRWSCVNATDPTCGTGEFPSAAAVGSRFGLEFFPGQDLPGEIGTFVVEPVSPTRLGSEHGAWMARRVGSISIVAIGHGYAVDYISLGLLEIDGVRLVHASGNSECVDDDLDGNCDPVSRAVFDGVVFLEQDMRVGAQPLHGGTDLGGAVEYQWESMTPDVLVVTPTADNRAGLRGLALGPARLRVQAGDHAEIIEITIEESPEPDPLDTTGTGDGDPTGSGTDTGPDSGSETGSDSGSDSGTEDSGGMESTTEGSSGGASTTGGDTEGSTTTGGAR